MSFAEAIVSKKMSPQEALQLLQDDSDFGEMLRREVATKIIEDCGVQPLDQILLELHSVIRVPKGNRAVEMFLTVFSEAYASRTDDETLKDSRTVFALSMAIVENMIKQMNMDEWLYHTNGLLPDYELEAMFYRISGV